MKHACLAVSAALFSLATPLGAQEYRDLDAHEHGVSTAEIAIEQDIVDIVMHSPGADIVGFEHAPHSAEDRAAIEDALETLRRAEAVVDLGDAAGCTLDTAEASLHGEEHEEHHDPKEHEDGDAASAHSEFETHYRFTCAAPEALTEVQFPFFDSFANAEVIEAQYVSDAGSGRAEITRGTPAFTLE